MSHVRKLPLREQVFLDSLKWFGFRITFSRKNLKFKRGYLIPSTDRENSSGIDVWVKIPNDRVLYPIQLTQRGIRIFRLLSMRNEADLASFSEKSDLRITAKREWCERDGIVFVLIRDYLGSETNLSIARRDFKALYFALAHAKEKIKQKEKRHL